MTEKQKQQVIDLQAKGSSYPAIAKALGISVNTVKSYCRRRQVALAKGHCRNCGVVLQRGSTQRTRSFCCDKCRYTWWNRQRRHCATHHLDCVGCGRRFAVSSGQQRKYCSHSCYIQTRYGRKI